MDLYLRVLLSFFADIPAFFKIMNILQSDSVLMTISSELINLFMSVYTLDIS